MKRFFLIILVTGLAFLPSCERRQDVEEQPAIQRTEYDAIMVILIDMSGSYAGYLDRAFNYFAKAADRFFRERLGAADDKTAGDRIIIAQISGGVTKSLLWEGSPRAFKTEFGSARAFKAYLQKKSDQFGSKVHGGITDSLEYLLGLPGVKEKRSKTSLFIFSDMEDNHDDDGKDKARLLKLFAEYGKVKGCVGMYWVDSRFVIPWREHLRDSGITHFVVHSEIVADAPLPSWDD